MKGPDLATLDAAAAELFERMPDGDASDKLVEAYLPLVGALARRFAGRGEPVDDLEQVASIGLINAIRRFDHGRGVRFSTYAIPTIVGELKRHFRDKRWAMRVPRTLQETGLRVQAVVAELTQDLGRSPAVAEVAQSCGLDVERVVEAMEVVRAYSLDPLDESPDEGAGARAHAGEDTAMATADDRATLVGLLRTLPPRDREVLYHRFWGNLTQSQIARRMGMSQMHVSRIVSRSLERLREIGTCADG